MDHGHFNIFLSNKEQFQFNIYDLYVSHFHDRSASVHLYNVQSTITTFVLVNSTSVHAFNSELVLQQEFTATNNSGVFSLVDTTLYLNGNALIQNNGDSIQGSVILLQSSRIVFGGETVLTHNTAGSWLLLASFKSELQVRGSVTFRIIQQILVVQIALYGGSTITIIPNSQHTLSTLWLEGNTAHSYGGGSSLKTKLQSSVSKKTSYYMIWFCHVLSKLLQSQIPGMYTLCWKTTKQV